MAKILGIDEAGRGPVIGSMFVSGFQLDSKHDLQDIKVKDSKKLSDEKRDQLFDELRQIGESYTIEVTASELNEQMLEKTINSIEMECFVSIIDFFEAEGVIIDLPEPDAQRFKSEIRGKLKQDLNPQIKAEHGADGKYEVVSAASIIAKTNRERHIDSLHRKYNADFKSGYPHEEETRKFLSKYFEQNGEMPEETRMHWSTVEDIINSSSQSSLDGFNSKH